VCCLVLVEDLDGAVDGGTGTSTPDASGDATAAGSSEAASSDGASLGDAGDATTGDAMSGEDAGTPNDDASD
jgi:hypothetical protein